MFSRKKIFSFLDSNILLWYLLADFDLKYASKQFETVLMKYFRREKRLDAALKEPRGFSIQSTILTVSAE